MQRAAMWYAQRYWRVFPCERRGKTPMLNHWQSNASNEPSVLQDFWRDNEDLNVALVTGEHFWVLDVDGEEGLATLASLEAKHGLLPKTPTVITPGGGKHLYFALPESEGVRQRMKFLPGLDTRACKGGERGVAGGYVLAPPSVHPNGGVYEWEVGPDESELAQAPEWLLKIISGSSADDAAVVQPSTPPRTPHEAANVVERARLYLQKCEPAVQGQGGHSRLLTAASALVHGFALDDATAYELLADDFNPRCTPPWNLSNPAANREFRRKLQEGKKDKQSPLGHLLNASKPLQGDVAEGRQIATSLMAATTTEEPTAAGKWEPFPTQLLPSQLREYVSVVAKAHCVDDTYVALPALGVGGAAMGNKFRLQLKPGWLVPPILWIAIVGKSGSNKTGPLRTVVRPLQETPAEISTAWPEEDSSRPERMVMQNATCEALVVRLNESDNGLLLFSEELRSWLDFGAYKRDGKGDESTWLKFHDASSHSSDRKTNDERIDIPEASVAVLGGIQPELLGDCFDPSRFASGLVPRLIFTYPPARTRVWTPEGVTDVAQQEWARVIAYLRTHPFVPGDGNIGLHTELRPNVVALSPGAEEVFIDFYNELGEELMNHEGYARSVFSKSDVLAARLALILHGFECVLTGDIVKPLVSRETMDRGIRISKWCRREALRIFKVGSALFEQDRAKKVVSWIRTKNGRTTVRELQMNHKTRYPKADDARADLELLLSMGVGAWQGKEFVLKEA